MMFIDFLLRKLLLTISLVDVQGIAACELGLRSECLSCALLVKSQRLIVTKALYMYVELLSKSAGDQQYRWLLLVLPAMIH